MKKKKKPLVYPLVLMGMLFMFSYSCKKKDDNNNSTPMGQVPVLTTSAVSNIIQFTATCGGNITSDGGSTVTARGVCWSTETTPTIADSKTTDGIGAGSFTSGITGLTLNTTYYVRAYATNSAGTGYGSAMSFTSSSSAIESEIGIVDSLIFKSRRLISFIHSDSDPLPSLRMKGSSNNMSNRRTIMPVRMSNPFFSPLVNVKSSLKDGSTNKI